LLRALETGEIQRIGGRSIQMVDVRIIAATNRRLAEEVAKGRFREDLYYRLNVITLALPPLRKRTEDIPLLARHFLHEYAQENEKALREISPRAMETLMDYHWPGNVRELENAIERAVVLSTGEVLDVDMLPGPVRQPASMASPPVAAPANGIPFKEAVGAYERQLIVKALKAAGGVQKKAAELLQVKPTTLHEMMKRLNISAESLTA
jgi:DNA-binding NtrC family response regulator